MAHLDQVQVLEGHTDRVWNVAWSPKGAPNAVHLYMLCEFIEDLFSDNKPARLQHSAANSMVYCVGDSIASCSGDKTVRIWRRQGETDTWVCAAILEETHHRSIRCSSWSPDGRYLATASFDATTAIWEVQVRTATGLTFFLYAHCSTEYSPAGKHVGTGSLA